MTSRERKCFIAAPLVVPENTNAQGADTFTSDLIGLRRSLQHRALFLAQDRAAADDLLQATFERALKSRAHFHRGSNLAAWTVSIMRNLFIDGRRRRAIRARHEERAAQMMLTEASPLATDPGSDADPLYVEAGHLSLSSDEPKTHGPLDFISLDDVRAAAARLPAAQRELFSLAYEQHLPYHEIAARLGIPLSTTGTRLLRARRRMRRDLQRLYEDRVRGRA